MDKPKRLKRKQHCKYQVKEVNKEGQPRAFAGRAGLEALPLACVNITMRMRRRTTQHHARRHTGTVMPLGAPVRISQVLSSPLPFDHFSRVTRRPRLWLPASGVTPPSLLRRRGASSHARRPLPVFRINRQAAEGTGSGEGRESCPQSPYASHRVTEIPALM